MDNATKLKMGLTVVLVATLAFAVVAAYAKPDIPPAPMMDQDKARNRDRVHMPGQNPSNLQDRSQARDRQAVPGEHSPDGPMMTPRGRGPPDTKGMGAVGAHSVIVSKDSTAGAEAITVLTRDLRKISMRVTSETVIQKNGATSNGTSGVFARLAVGDFVGGQVKNVSGVRTAVRISAVTPSQLRATGTIQAASGSSLTIETPKKDSLVFNIDTSATSPTFTVIKKGKETVTPSTLSTGDRAQISFIVKPDGTLAAITVHAVAPAEGF